MLRDMTEITETTETERKPFEAAPLIIWGLILSALGGGLVVLGWWQALTGSGDNPGQAALIWGVLVAIAGVVTLAAGAWRLAWYADLWYLNRK